MAGQGMGNEETTFLVKILLGKFDFTPVTISGHESIIPIWLPEVDAQNQKTGLDAFILMFDFMLPKKEATFEDEEQKGK